MSFSVENVDATTFVRFISSRLAMRAKRSRRYSSTPVLNNSHLQYRELIAENLSGIDENQGNYFELRDWPIKEEPDMAKKSEDQSKFKKRKLSFWKSLCCLPRFARTSKSVPPTPAVSLETVIVPEVVVNVTEELLQKKKECVQALMDLIDLKSEASVSVKKDPPVKSKYNPDIPISRRGDIPIVVSSGKRPFPRGNHQYYRSSWRLKPSVNGAPETLGNIQE